MVLKLVINLAQKYSKALDLQYLDQTMLYVWMGSYGIEPCSLMAARPQNKNADENVIGPDLALLK